jgi:hypothetical protein
MSGNADIEIKSTMKFGVLNRIEFHSAYFRWVQDCCCRCRQLNPLLVFLSGFAVVAVAIVTICAVFTVFAVSVRA